VQLWAIFGRPFVKRFALCYQTVVCLSGVLWPNGWTDQNETWHTGRPRPWPHCVRWEPPEFSAHICCGQMAGLIKTPLGTEVGLSPGDLMLDRDPAPFHKKDAEPPKFLAHVYCGQTAGWIKMAFGMEVRLSPGDFMLDRELGTQSPLPKKGAEPPPQFSAHFYCGETAEYIKMPLSIEVGLSPGDFVFDRDPAPLPKKGAEPQIFGPCLLQPNGCMDQDATWYRRWPRPRRHCVRWGPSSSPSPPPKGGRAPNFRPMSIVAKWLDGLRCHLVWR